MAEINDEFVVPDIRKLKGLVMGDDFFKDVYLPFNIKNGSERKDVDRFKICSNPSIVAIDGSIAGVSAILKGKIESLLKLVGLTESGQFLLSDNGISSNGEIIFEEGKRVSLLMGTVRDHFDLEQKKVVASAGEYGEGAYDETFDVVEDVRLHLLKTVEVGNLFFHCEGFDQCKELFDSLASISGFEEELLNVCIFEMWLKKCLNADEGNDEEHVIYVLDLMKEHGYSATLNMANFLVSVGKDMHEVVERLPEWGFASVINSLPVWNKRISDAEGHAEAKELFYKMIARGVTPDEKIYSLWLKKLTLQADIFDAMYTVSTRLNGFPNEFSKALVLEFLSREDQKYLNYIRNGIFQKGCFEEEYFAGVKTDPEFAEGALEIFLAKWKIDNNSDFIELFWNAVAGKYGQFSHFCSYTKGLAYYYKFLRKRSLLVHGEHALTHCKTVEEYTEILEYLWDKDIPLSLNTVNSVKFTGEAPVTQQLVDAMEELFASKKIGNFEELYCLHRLGQTPDYYLKIVGEEKVPVNMVPWLELYGKVRGLVLTDQVEDIMNSVDLAWPQDDEEPILPPGRFLYKFDLKDKEWEELKVKVEEYFSGEERPDIKLKKRSGLPNEWLVFYAFINKKIKKIVGRKGQGSKIKGSNSRKRPRRKKKK